MRETMKMFAVAIISISLFMIMGDYSSPNGNLYDSHGNLDVTSKDSAGNKDVMCNNSVQVNDSASGPTQLIAAGASQQIIYVCGWFLAASGVVTESIQTGTGTNCAANNTTPHGPVALTTAFPDSFVEPSGFAFAVPAGSALCLNLTAAVQVGGNINYAGPF